MSYSRWGGRNSGKFYTYWLSTESKVREEQMFDISGFTAIEYKDYLDLGMDGLIDMLKERLQKMNDEWDADPTNDRGKVSFLPESYTDAEWEELKIYIGEWVADVKEEFDTPSQLYRDGKITLEDAFIEEV
jgi:hypothetical protein